MNEDTKGQYVERAVGYDGVLPDHTTTLRHFVESIIAGDVVTACGRRMKPKTSKGDLIVVTWLVGEANLACSACTRIVARKVATAND